MAWGEVQSNWPANTGITGTSLNFAANLTVGNIVILATFTDSPAPPTPSSASVASWTQIGSAQNRGDGYYSCLFWGIVTSGGNKTVSYSGTFGYTVIGAVEFSPGSGVPVFDSGSATGASGNSGSNLSIAVTAAAANELIISYASDSASPGTITAQAGNTTIPATTGTGNNVFAYILSGSSGSNTSGSTISSGTLHSIIAGAFSIQSPDVQSLGISPASVTYPTTATGTVTLNMAAGSGGVVVNLSSSDSTVATVPATVTVAQGNTTATFTVTSLNKTGSSTISATVTGTVTAGISVTAEPVAATPAFSPIAGTYLSAQTVTISSTTSGGTIFYTTDGTNPNHGSSSISNGGTVSVSQSLTLKAILSVSGFADSAIGSAAYVITADIASLGVSPSSVIYPANATGTVTLTGPAPSGGITVNLSSSNPAVATVPSSITIAQGQSSGTFQVTSAQMTGSSTIRATVISMFTAPIQVIDARLTNLIITPSTVEYPTIAIGTVTADPAAPSGGYLIDLVSGDPTIATVPATVLIPEGQTSVDFVVTSLNKTGTSLVTASGIDEVTVFAPIMVNAAVNTPAPPPKLQFSKRTTAATAMFPCIFIASPQGAQMITSVVSQISALSMVYGQLVNIYPALIHQDTANNDADLNVQINAAVSAVSNLNTNIQALTVTFPYNFVLVQYQIVVYNALQFLLAAQANESIPDPD